MFNGSSYTPKVRKSDVEDLVKNYYEELRRITGRHDWYEGNGREFVMVEGGLAVRIFLDSDVSDQRKPGGNIRSLAVRLSTPDLRGAFDFFGYLAHKYYENYLANNVVLVAPTNPEQIESRNSVIYIQEEKIESVGHIHIKGYNLRWNGMKDVPGRNKESKFIGGFEDVRKAIFDGDINFSRVSPDYSGTNVIGLAIGGTGIGQLTLHGKNGEEGSYSIRNLFVGEKKEVLDYAIEIDRAIEKSQQKA